MLDLCSCGAERGGAGKEKQRMGIDAVHVYTAVVGWAGRRIVVDGSHGQQLKAAPTMRFKRVTQRSE